MTIHRDPEASTHLARKLWPRFNGRPVLVALPFTADALPLLRATGSPVTAWHHDHAAYRADPGPGVFAAEPPAGSFGAGLLFLPKERELSGWAMEAVAGRLEPGAPVLVVGPNRGGIRAAGPAVEHGVGPIEETVSGGHCRAIFARVRREASQRTVPLPMVSFGAGAPDDAVTVCSVPGVFAHGSVDPGSRLLLDVLRDAPPAGPVLDWGCGNGVLGAVLSARDPELRVVATDRNAFALEAARATLAANRPERVRLVPGSRMEDLPGGFGTVVTNPPFHEHIRSDASATQRFLAGTRDLLLPGGRLVLVANRFLKYPEVLVQSGARVRVAAETDRFRVIEASWPVERE